MPRSRKSSRASAEKEQNWAKLYGQPKDPRTPESYANEWQHWNVDRVEAEEAASPEIGVDEDELPVYVQSDKENEEPEIQVTFRKKNSRKASKSPSPNLASEKLWSRAVPEDESERNQSFVLIITFVIIAAALLGCGCLIFMLEKVTKPNLLPAFDRYLNELKQQFPSQPAHNWGIVRGALAEVLNTSNYEHGPAVLVILASKKDQHLATCFSEKLSNILAKTFIPGEQPIVFNGAQLRNSKDEIAAKHTIHNAVKNRDNFVMQFNSLEQLEPYTASIFHSLCDYYNSPFQERAVFLFTVHTVDDVDNRKRREYDVMADKVLNDAWYDLDINKRSALIARLTGNTILLRRESRRIC